MILDDDDLDGATALNIRGEKILKASATVSLGVNLSSATILINIDDNRCRNHKVFR